MSETLLQEIGADAKAIFQKVENFFETNPQAVAVENDFKTAFNDGVAIVERNGGQLLYSAATNVLPLLLTGSWAAAVAQLLVDAKAAGASTFPAEEQLAASLALQTAQTITGIQSPNGATADGATTSAPPTSSSASDAAPSTGAEPA